MGDPRPPLTRWPGGDMPRHQGEERPDLESAGSERNGARDGLELTALGAGLVLVTLLMARLGSWTRELGAFQVLYVLGFGFFGLAMARARDSRPPRAGLLVMAVAAAARLALLPVAPSLSDDVYRYLWEGRVAAHGQDPYRHAPGDSSLASLRDRLVHPRINHPHLAAIYPPLAIAGFALVTTLSPTVWAMKAWIVFHDLMVVLLLLAWSRARRTNPLWVIAYAWNPLVLVEYAGSAHHDPVALVWLVAALVWAERHPTRSALALAAGVLTKLAPLVALPFLLRRWPWRARLVALTTIGVGLAWYLHAARGPASGLPAYGRTWANNELAFHYLARLVSDPGWARAAAGALAALAVGVAMRRGWESGRGARFAARIAFLLSPVAHPWYLGWVLAFETLGPSAPWLLLSLTAVLSYGVLSPPPAGGSFHLPLAWRWFEYGAPLALAGALAWRGRARFARPRPGT